MRLYTCIIFSIICIVFAATAYAEDLTEKSNINLVRTLYGKVSQTLPSVINAEENEDIIRDRLACYEQYHEYAQRIRICNNAYIKRIVSGTRKAVKSRPSLGSFVLNVGLCPIVYNVCVGQTENDKERCIRFERQCIDYTLDTFWRGAAQYTQQTYRLDQ